MDYEGLVKKVLYDAGADEGDLVEVTLGERTFRGVVMPHHQFSDRDILTIKLDSGYNIGLDLSKGVALRLVAKGEMPAVSREGVTAGGDKACVAFLSTGGTIASFVDYRTGAVHPALTSRDLIFANPELAEHCEPCAKVLYSVLSENMRPDYWVRLAQEAAAELEDGATGIVVPHGTDTMGYTAAALSFMLQDLTGPIVLVGSQRSSDRPSSDAHMNLIAAVAVAKADLGEVVVVMHEGTSDRRLAVHRGTKVRKMHSSRRDAFRSMNTAPLGHVELGEEAEGEGTVVLSGHRTRSPGPLRLEAAIEPRVALLHFYPGMNPGLLLDALKHDKGVVIAGTGLGHVSDELIKVIEDLDEMRPIVVTTQCLEGTVDLEVYSSGRDLMKAGVIQGGDMLPETALVKLMWALGRTVDIDEVRRIMTTDIAGELGPRRGMDSDRGRT